MEFSQGKTRALLANQVQTPSEPVEAVTKPQSSFRAMLENKSRLRAEALSPVLVDELANPAGALPSKSELRCSDKGFVNMSLEEYLQLLDWTARTPKAGKPGRTPTDFPPILERVQIKSDCWLCLMENFGSIFHNVAGRPHEVARARSLKSNARHRVRTKLKHAFHPS